MSDEMLKPCPFCGGPSHFYENEVDFVPKWSVGCDECPASFDACEDTKAEVAVLWNHRAAAASAEPVGYVSPATLRLLGERAQAGHICPTPAYDTTIPLYTHPPQEIDK